jgi:hypothetical protein
VNIDAAQVLEDMPDATRIRLPGRKGAAPAANAPPKWLISLTTQK